MAMHYFSDIIHVTAKTKSGQRRSPLADIAYNSGQTLTDKTTGRKHNRPHKDGTVIVAGGILSNDPNCKFADQSIPSATRREMMYNELYSLNKNDSCRVYAKAVVALPNSFNDEQMKEVAELMAVSLSKWLHRPVEYNVHKKVATKYRPANNHVHFVWPERKYLNNGWGPLSESYYVNMDGTINYERIYKDSYGNDIRRPRIKKGTPKEVQFDRDDNGDYKYQVRDSHGRRKWSMINVAGLKQSDIQWMHDEMDRINNMVLDKYQINDHIQRNDPRVTEFLKRTGMLPVHYGRRDAKEKNADYHKKVLHNQRSEYYNKYFTKVLAEQDKGLESIRSARNAELKARDALTDAQADLMLSTIYKRVINEDYHTAIKEYVEELNPENLFVNNAIDEFTNKYAQPRQRILSLAEQVLMKNTKSASITIKNAEKTSGDPIRELNLSLWKTNFKSMKRLLNGIRHYTKSIRIIDKITTLCRSRWQSFLPEEKIAYVRKSAGTEASSLYADYLGTYEDTSILSPHHFASTLPALETDRLLGIIKEWDTDAKGVLHMSPTNIEPLNIIENADKQLTGKTASVPLVPADYDPLEPLLKYKADYDTIKPQPQKEENEIMTDQPKKQLSDRLIEEAYHGDFKQNVYDRITAKTTECKLVVATQTADAMIADGHQHNREELIECLMSNRGSKLFSNKSKFYGIDATEYRRWSELRTAYFRKKNHSKLKLQNAENNYGNDIRQK